MTILCLFFDHTGNPMKILLIMSPVNSYFDSQLLFKEVTISRHPLIFLSDPNLQKLQTSNAEVPFHVENKKHLHFMAFEYHLVTSTENPLFHHAEKSNPIIFFPPQNLQIARLLFIPVVLSLHCFKMHRICSQKLCHVKNK